MALASTRQCSQPSWKSGKNWKITSPFSSQGKVREFEKSPSNQGILFVQLSDFLALPFSLLPHWPKRAFSPHARNCTRQIGQSYDPGILTSISEKSGYFCSHEMLGTLHDLKVYKYVLLLLSLSTGRYSTRRLRPTRAT